MSENHDAINKRRRFLQLVGGGTLALPLIGLSACSKETQDAPAAPAGAPSAEDVADDVADEVAEAVESVDAPVAGGDMPKLAEDDPQAKALAYTHDASTVDAGTQPRYQAGQLCRNCALYQGDEGDEWAGCSIFPGKLVNGAGWCSVYAPKVG